MTSIQWQTLAPIDAWFFRDGTPLERGESSIDIRSLFPPPSTTVSGSIRSALARANGWDPQHHTSWCDLPKGKEIGLNEILGDGPNELGKLKFMGPLLTRDGSPLFAMPRHLLGLQEPDESGGTQFNVVDRLRPGEPLSSDLDTVALPEPSGAYKQPSGGAFPDVGEGYFLTLAGLQTVIDGKLPSSDDCISKDELFALEPRVGIERNLRLRRVIDGSLYNLSYIRPRPGVGMLFGMRGLPDAWDVPSTVALGGESRMASVDSFDAPGFALPTLSESQRPSDNLVLLVLLTPALLAVADEGDSRLRFWGAGFEESAESLCGDIKGHVRSLAIDRPQRIGGWNGLTGAPEPMLPFAPAGSVWWIELAEDYRLPSAPIQIGHRTSHGYGLAVFAKP